MYYIYYNQLHMWLINVIVIYKIYVHILEFRLKLAIDYI